MAKIQIKSEKLTPFFLVIIYRSFASFAPHALKGQKLLAQGSALGYFGRKVIMFVCVVIPNLCQ